VKKKIVEPDMPQVTIWRMRIACWIRKFTDTHSKFVILNAFSGATVVARKPSLGLHNLFRVNFTFVCF